MKGRWRILKTGIRVEGVDTADKIWLTCCALHNWLLDTDGLDEEWTDGMPTSVWTGEMGRHDFEGIEDHIPNAISRLSTNLEPCNYDMSRMGRGEDVVNIHPADTDQDVDAGVPPVQVWKHVMMMIMRSIFSRVAYPSSHEAPWHRCHHK